MFLLLTGVGLAFSPWFWLFLTLKFLSNVALGGITLNAFVLAMELMGTIYLTTKSFVFY